MAGLGAVHVIFALERVRPEYSLAAPDVSESDESGAYSVLRLESLLIMKLTSFRDKDRTHIRDFIEVGLVDETWIHRLPPELGTRLQELLDTPHG